MEDYLVTVHASGHCGLDLSAGRHCMVGSDPNVICPAENDQVKWQGDLTVSPRVSVSGVVFEKPSPCQNGKTEFGPNDPCLVVKKASSTEYHYALTFLADAEVCPIGPKTDPKMIIQSKHGFTLDTFLHFPGVLLPILILAAIITLLVRRLRFRNAT
jgi:hypothetical protein